MKDIQDPETKMTVWKRSQLARIGRAPAAGKAEARRRVDLPVGALGSGSDYTVFLDHLGVASVNLGYGGEGGGGGVYHSIYDDFYWYTHFSDTDFSYGRALSQTAGTAVMRLADATVLPFQFGDFTETVRGYIDDLKKLDADQRAQTEERNREIDEGVFTALTDPKIRFDPPPKDPIPPHLNFAPLENGIDALTRSAQKYDAARQKANPSNVKAVNAKLIESERLLIDNSGLPGRPWFRHMIYAPGFYTGYGVKTIPGVREAIEQKRWQEADEQIQRVGVILTKEADLLDEATAALGR